MCRVRQVLELIAQERREYAKFQTQLVEWQTKNVCAMFATMARDSKHAKAIQKVVEKIRLPLADEEADLIDDRTPEQILEEGARVDLENQPAFEALNAAMQNL